LDLVWSIQALRFFAAAMVVWLHVAHTAAVAAKSYGIIPHEIELMGRAGVDVFFVISGFVISLTAPKLRWQDFAWRRFRRIVPIYYVLLVPVVVVALLQSGISWRAALATFLLWPATDVMTVPLLQVAWTLCFEAVFYIAAALVLANRAWLPALLGLYTACLILREQAPVFQFLGSPLILEFLFGVVIARMPGWRPAAWGLPVGVAMLALVGYTQYAPQGEPLDVLMGMDGFLRVAAFGVPAALIVYATAQLQLKPGLLTELGAASYAIYLSHALIVSPLQSLWTVYPLPHDVIVLIVVPACILFGWRIHVRFEKPLLAVLTKLQRQYAAHLT
jgi:exopolysaccharide production protein ExoZ